MLRTWLSAWLALSALGVLWALANPIGNSPDEPAQIARAASLVRGHPIGSHIKGLPAAYTSVDVPRTYALQYNSTGGPSGGHDCYHFLPFATASCERILSSSRTIADPTYMGRYPPLYFAVVGLPTLLTTGEAGLYLMRVLSVLVTSAFLALAVMTARRWSTSPILVAAVWVVTTPTAVFIDASVNASGLEIAAATCAWVAGAVLVLEFAKERPPAGLVAVAVSSGAVMALTRPISPLWLALMVLTLAAVGWGRVSIAVWRRSRAVVRGGAVLVAVTYLALAWVAAFHSFDLVPEGPPLPGTPVAQILASSTAAVWQGLGQVPGTFGWLDTHEPGVAVLAVVVAAGLPIGLGFARSSRRDYAALLALIAVSIVVPVLLVAAADQKDGLEAQGRYFMPLWVGVPLLAAALQRSMPGWAGRRLRSAMIGPPLVAMFLAFWWSLHRVAVGVGGPLFPWDTPAYAWTPPVPATVLDALCLAAVVAVGVVFFRLSAPLPAGPD